MEGFTVLIAHDGAEGIDVARSDRPDVIVSDIMMPKKSGLELVTDLKGDRDTSDIPIILLSAKAQNADVRSGLDSGADEYVTKPFEPLDLVDRVNRLLEARASRRPS
jgi:DNA-binding response OmpR family regulator